MRLPIALLATAILLTGEILSDWKNVEQLTPGRHVEVVRTDHKTVRGTLRQADGAGVRARFDNEGQNGDIAVAGALLAGAAIGAAIGASREHFETVYRIEKLPGRN